MMTPHPAVPECRYIEPACHILLDSSADGRQGLRSHVLSFPSTDRSASRQRLEPGEGRDGGIRGGRSDADRGGGRAAHRAARRAAPAGGERAGGRGGPHAALRHRHAALGDAVPAARDRRFAGRNGRRGGRGRGEPAALGDRVRPRRPARTRHREPGTGGRGPTACRGDLKPMGNESVARCATDAEPDCDYAAVFARIEAKIPALVEEGRRLLQEAEGLLAQLLRRPASRRWRVIERPGFARPALVYLLLDASEARLRQAPAEAGNLAQLAARLAFRLEPALRKMAPEAVQAFCLMGNARRQLGDFAIAEMAFERASLLALDRADRGRCCRGLGLLRWEQGWVDEGLERLEQSVRHFEQEGAGAEAGISQALLGLCLVNERRYEAARALRLQAWQAVSAVDAGGRLAFHWLEARLTGRLGERRAARLQLETVRGAAIEGGWCGEAILVTLDQGPLLGDREDSSALQRGIAEIEAAFAGQDGLREGCERLRTLVQEPPASAAEDGPAWDEHVRAVRRLLRGRGIRPEPLPFG